ncbi:uncharacterized protein A4U43_C08F22590 [Asparagus officinalis]|uniref:serine carboxypeptidase-like 40 n=1 Tax=Asparagus officinalis TaxID=4686 RepID=UPI00098E682C|nr:serine carboxypeptidase-like 40 [Asparagus officinalis]ONK60786.1 uncharacterized protein A4U43_C08F22590 [Asparagus officinalis]
MRHHMTLIHLTSCLYFFSFYLCTVNGYGDLHFDPIDKFVIKAIQRRDLEVDVSRLDNVAAHTSVYISAQDGLMEADKIDKLPGQPEGVDFDQYAGYVTVDPIAGHALFYYFVEATQDPASKPLLLWLTGGPGCSSFGHGAMTGLGPFRVNSDGKTLIRNEYAWNKVASIIFLESPVGVGFSYSNTTSDYDQIGDTKTAQGSYTFIVNWLERFPQYKTQGFYIAGDGYAGHYVPQLAYTILVNNKLNNQTIINLQGIAIGNGWMDDEATLRGMYDYWWTHNLIPNEIHDGITSRCNFSSTAHKSASCQKYLDKAQSSRGDIYIYDIYSTSCNSSSHHVLSSGGFDTCSYAYTRSYLNLPQVQEALHANITALPYIWEACTSVIESWKDWHPTILPTIKLLTERNLRLWIYSGDTDARVSITSTNYFIDKLNISVNTSWYPWYAKGEIAGYAIGYQNLTFASVRGGGHFVPSFQPDRALTLFSSFLEGKLPPNSPSDFGN